MTSQDRPPDRLQICRTCILPIGFPSANFDEHGVCFYCRTAGQKFQNSIERRALLEKKVLGAIASHRSTGIALAFSGGADSSKALIYLKKTFSVPLLAVTVDNGFLSSMALDNCERIARTLEVEHLVIRPPRERINSLFRVSLEEEVHSEAALARASSLCNTCIRIVDALVLRSSLERGFRVVAWGFVEGQAAMELGGIEFDVSASKPLRSVLVRRFAESISGDASNLLQLDATSSGKVFVFSPMQLGPDGNKELDRELSSMGWKMPPDTGNFSSNCRIKVLGIEEHRRRKGIHPYTFKLAAMVRGGAMSREDALLRLGLNSNGKLLDDLKSELWLDERHKTKGAT